MNRTIAAVGVVALAASVLLVPRSSCAESPSANDAVTRATLSNGLRVIVVRDPLAPVVSMQIAYLVGSDEAPPGFPGMAHAQEHMAFGRSLQGLTTTQLADVGTAMGGDFNAQTQDTVTRYFYTVPVKDVDVALHVLSLQVHGALDTNADWNEERGAIEQEVSQDLSNAFYRFFSAAFAHLFAGTPYQHDALGTRPSFDKTTGDMLRAWYQKWYQPNNAVLVIVGDVDPAATLASVKQLFGPLKSKAVPARPAVHLQALKAKTITLESDQPVAFVFVAYRLPGYDDADYAASQILADVLASQRADLYALGAEGKALQAGFFPFEELPKAGAGLAYAALPPGADTKAMTGTLKGVIEAYKTSGVPQDLVDAAIRQEVAQAQFNRNSINGLANAWTEAVAVEGRSSPDDDIAAFQKVTKADVDRVLRKYFDGSTALVGILTPKPAGGAVASKGFGGPEAPIIKNPKQVPLPSWAQVALSDLSVPPSTVSPTSVVLPNGIRLIVQTEHVSPTVTLVGEVKNNSSLQTPPGQEGVNDVLDGLFSYGTTTLDRLAFQKALDDIAAQESAGTSFSLSVLSSNFDRGVQLLADNELHPALPAQAFAIVQQQTAGIIAGQQKSPDYLASRAMLKALYPPNDPLQREASPASVSALKLDDVKAYHGAVFRPDLTAIVVIGDITPDDAKASIQKWFGAWTASGPTPQTDLPPAPNNAPGAANVPATGRVQDSTSLTETLGIVRSDPDYYPLQLGATVLGGSFYSTRLFRELREKLGYVYYVGERFSIGKTRSTFSVQYGSDPQNVSKARTVIERELRSMQSAPVTPDELQLAKVQLLTDTTLAESTEDAIANGLLRRSVVGLPLDEPTVAANRYVATTAEQIQSAFAKWVRVNDFVQIVTGPPPK